MGSSLQSTKLFQTASRLGRHKGTNTGFSSNGSRGQAMPIIWLVNYKAWWVTRKVLIWFLLLIQEMFLCVTALATLEHSFVDQAIYKIIHT